MKITIGTLLYTYWNVLNLVYASSVPRGDYGELKIFGAPATYSVDTTVLLNDVSRKDKEIGYKIKASLDLVPVWSKGDSEFLLKFQLTSPQLHSRGTHITSDFVPYKSLWDSYPSSTFYAHWKNGLIEASYLDGSDPTAIINYKKSLISLFQFQVMDGEHNETDISGTCSITYETLSMQVIRKVKNNCWAAEEMGAPADSRRLTRYTLSGALDALEEVYAEELHAVGDGPAGAALKARAWQRLTRAAAAPPAPPAAAALPAALAALPAALAALPAALAPHSLEPLPTTDSFDDEPEAGAALAAGGALRAERAGGGGDEAGALAALDAPAALRRAARPALDALLEREREPEALAALCALLGLAGGAAAHGAAAAFLQLHRREPLEPLARRYLAALALADEPQESVVLDVLKVGEGGGPLAGAALLAAAAAAPRAVPSAARAERHIKDALVKGLAKCKEEQCEVERLQALGNLRRADCAALLLAHAERARTAPAALAALDALGGLDARAALAAPDALRRLEALALAPRRAALAALDVRAAALDLLLALSAPAPMHLHRTARALHDGEPELRRVFWQRLRQLAAEPAHAHVRTLLRSLPPRLASWHARAAPGTSSALSRGVGAWRGRAARLDSLQLAARALLRRGRVRLQLLDAANRTHDVFAVEVWTRGLQALAGGADAGEEAEEAAGGLALAVGGARLPGVTLFEGQGELLGHVWAGRGSEPTPVLRALWPLRPAAGRVPLQAGAVLRWRLRAALSLALDAQAQVSLWSRSARSQLELRAALVAQCDARVATGGAALGGRARLTAEPRLRIAADLDFYTDAALCVRVSVPAHEYRVNTTLQAALGAHRVRRARLAAHPAPARTLALGAPNDVTCRTLTSADD